MKGIKALVFCLATFVLAVSTSHAASVNMTSPKAGEAWKIGETKNIEWNYSGPDPGAQKWKLVLKKGAADVGTIANKVSGSRYSWSVGKYTGGNATPGADYTIQVLNVASSQIKSSSGAFSISIPRITQKMEGPKQPQPIGPAPKTTPPATATPKPTPPANAGPKWEPNFSVVGYPKIMRIEGLAIPSRELIIKGNRKVKLVVTDQKGNYGFVTTVDAINELDKYKIKREGLPIGDELVNFIFPKDKPSAQITLSSLFEELEKTEWLDEADLEALVLKILDRLGKQK